MEVRRRNKYRYCENYPLEMTCQYYQLLKKQLKNNRTYYENCKIAFKVVTESLKAEKQQFLKEQQNDKFDELMYDGNTIEL